MQNEEQLTPAERELETGLGRLRPAGHNIERDRLMFLAGQASMRSRLFLWRGASAVFAVAFGFSLATRQIVQPAGRPEYAQSSPARIHEVFPVVTFADDASLSDGARYLVLRQAVLVRGIDALPPASSHASATEQPIRLRQLWDQAHPAAKPAKWNLFDIEKLVSDGAES